MWSLSVGKGYFQVERLRIFGPRSYRTLRRFLYLLRENLAENKHTYKKNTTHYSKNCFCLLGKSLITSFFRFDKKATYFQDKKSVLTSTNVLGSNLWLNPNTTLLTKKLNESFAVQCSISNTESSVEQSPSWTFKKDPLTQYQHLVMQQDGL